jgi:hypothetical protein
VLTVVSHTSGEWVSGDSGGSGGEWAKTSGDLNSNGKKTSHKHKLKQKHKN